ncbi:IS66 family insertion sequence element accessory protein TnpB [Flavitalea flava]
MRYRSKRVKERPLSAAVFIFLNRRRNQVKLLLLEGVGFSLYHKRLEKGISLRHIRKRKRYQHRG